MVESSIKYGSCYSNGIYGNCWAVRQVTREHADGSVSFKNVAGPERRKSATMAREEYAHWVGGNDP